MVLFLCFGFGGLLLGFLPLFWCLCVPSSINYQGILFRAAWLGGAISSGTIVWFFLASVFPYTWGLPPSWIPNKWNPCKTCTANNIFTHRLNVSQKALTRYSFSYYTKYMATVLGTDKQIAIIGGPSGGFLYPLG